MDGNEQMPEAMEHTSFNDNLATNAEREPVHLIRAFSVPGYLPGMSQACVVVELVLASQASRHALETLDRLMAESLRAPDLGPAPHPSVQAHGLLRRLVAGTLAVLGMGGMPVTAPPMVVGRVAGTTPAVRLALPSYGADQVTLDALRWFAELMNVALSGQPVDDAWSALPELVERIGRQAPQGINTTPFIDAAHQARIPVRHIWGNVFQFGWGSRSRLLDSSLTDETSSISTQLAKSKRAAARVMREAGIPVPRHEVAKDADDAVRIAAELGFPVVVKPGDQDGGLGVAAGLRSAEAVRRAFAAARALSGEVLVEKHAEGNDYRIHVYKGDAYWAVQRVPGGVTGDGHNTIEQLLAHLNADPRRGDLGSKAALKRIALDDEANELLLEQGFTAQSVPASGLFVRLRQAANVARGGVPVPALHLAHPDNLALASRAARALRLDLAGVDLLIPDIGRSWFETGAAICEINAQPQYSPGGHLRVLQRLVSRDGRIPVVVVLGDEHHALCHRIAGGLAPFGCVGIATSDEVCVGSKTVAKGAMPAYQAGLVLLGDTSVDLAVIGISDLAVLNTGIPVDSFDVLVLAGPMKAGEDAGGWLRWHSFAAMLASMCTGRLIVNQDCSAWVPDRVISDPQRLDLASHDNLPDAVRRALTPSPT